MQTNPPPTNLKPFFLAMDDIFEVQDEIAKTIVGALELTIGGRTQSRIVQRPTRNVEAYNHYLPMLNVGTWKTKLDKFDNWTVRTLDAKLSAQFEHTILMGDEGPEILTVTQNGPQEGHTF